MAMDAESEDAHMPKKEVSQDQESFGNANEEDVKANEALKAKIKIKSYGKTNDRASCNFNGNRTKTGEKKPKDVWSGVATEDVKVIEKDVDIEKDKKTCDILSPENVVGGDDSSKNCPFLDLKDNEKKVLEDLRSKLEEAISTNKLYDEEHDGQSKMNDEKQEEKEEDPKMKNQEKSNMEVEKIQELEFEKDVSLWGVPLLPSKGDERTDIILEKFLKARDFKVNEAYELLRNTLWWRKENKIDSILVEDFGGEFDSVAYMSGFDREGHPVCYNVYGVFGDDELYTKTFGTEESRQRFLRWRLQMMEREIQKLNFKPDGISSLLQINDLKNTPGPARKDLRIAMKQAVGTLQDNYPEFVARNIFINVPFWYYAFNALLSPFLTHRTKSKFLFVRPARVTETLLKHISAAEIPIHYGGLHRENDLDFSIKDVSSEAIVKGGSIKVIEIPAPKEGSNLVWDLTVIGWEVNYKEEFIPENEASFTVIVKEDRRMGWQEESVRNSFKNSEPGKVVLTIENTSFRKKRALYRFKTIKGSTSS